MVLASTIVRLLTGLLDTLGGGSWDNFVAASFSGGRPASFWLTHLLSIAIIVAVTIVNLTVVIIAVASLIIAAITIIILVVSPSHHHHHLFV